MKMGYVNRIVTLDILKKIVMENPTLRIGEIISSAIGDQDFSHLEDLDLTIKLKEYERIIK